MRCILGTDRIALMMLALAAPAHAQTVSYVSGELRGTTAVLTARYAVNVDGPMTSVGGTSLELPDRAAATRVVVHSPDGVHRLPLVEAAAARTRFDAINDTHGAQRWAVLVEAQGRSLELSVAAPHDARLMIDVELHVPTCFYRDARYVQLPPHWKSVLSPRLRSRFGKLAPLARACRDQDGVEDDELWISFPTAPHPDRIGTNAARIDLGDAHIARAEISVSARLGEVPHDLATAIVVDGSRSMTTATLEAQREVVNAYTHAAGDTQVQLIAYARTARPLLPSWMTARAARARVDRALRAIAPRNGSNLDVGLVEAARWLAQHAGTKRVVLVTDELLSRDLRARFDTLAKLLPEGTLVHVIAVDNSSIFERDHHAQGVTLAESTGGIAVRSGVPETPIDATMLVRPVRIDSLELAAPGWKQFEQAIATTCQDTLDEGHGCVWWGEGDAVAGPISVAGKLWGKRITRVLSPDPAREVELARELVDMNVLGERAHARAQNKARAAGPGWAFYAEWGRAGGYADGSIAMRGSCCHRMTRGSTGPTVRVGHMIGGRTLPVVDLSPQFAHVVARCGLGDAHVEATLELTGIEIVDVSVLAPPAATRCVEDAIWETMITPPDPRMFRTRSRIVIVH